MQNTKKTHQYILGLSCFYHDSSACILLNGKILASASEERFSRKKHDDGFPLHSIEYCLKKANIDINQIDAIAFYEKPIVKFERILKEFIVSWPRNVSQFYRFMPQWLGQKLFMGNTIHNELKQYCKKNYDKAYKLKTIRTYYIPHHLSHASSSYFTSPFEEAAVVTIDGVGENTTTAIYKCIANEINPVQHITYPDSLGLLYSAFTYYLGFRVNSGEYKMMGLAPYGTPKYTEQVKKTLTIFDDGSYELNQKYFKYRWGERMISKHFATLLGEPIREASEPVTQFHKDMAASIQSVTEEIILKIVTHAKLQTNCKNLCLSGGVALNCVANGKILEEKIFENIHIFPGCGDDGGAVGAALFLHRKLDTTTNQIKQSSPSPYLGPSNSNKEIESFLSEHNIPFQKKEEQQLCNTIAQEIIENNAIIGHFNGRMEFGPRALGNRSILADPRNEENWKRVNLQIKFRESFRPFAPAVLEEKCSEVFDLEVPSPYMLYVAQVKHTGLPAITHVDNSARIQTVSREQNPRFHGLIKAFDDQTGVPVLINTSFNVRGEPIVCDYLDAWKCFLHTGIDILVLNDYIINARDLNREDFKKKFPTSEFAED